MCRGRMRKMLSEQGWLRLADDLDIELRQSEEEGKDINGFAEKVGTIRAMKRTDPRRELEAADLFNELAMLPIREGYEYTEPSDLDGIKKTRPRYESRLNNVNFDKSEVYDKIY